jgi:ABC-type Fe3+-hydroxamate transport system substrate-binding protein
LSDEERLSLISPSSRAILANGSLEFEQSAQLVDEAERDAAPILDIGTPGKSSVDSLDNIEASTGQPATFLDGRFEQLSSSYRLLGNLLQEDRCFEMSDYIDDVVSAVLSKQEYLAEGSKKRIYVASGPTGMKVETFDYLQANVFDYLSCECVNAQVASFFSPDGDVSIVDLDDLVGTDIDAIIFKDAIGIDVGDRDEPIGSLWKNVPVVRKGDAHCAPMTEFSWVGSPLVSQCLGVLWLGTSLHPEAFSDIDLLEYAERFYELFVHCEDVSDTLASLVVDDTVRIS